MNRRAVAGLMIARYQTFRVGEDRVFVLHHAVRRQAAVALRAIHRAACQQHAQAEPLRRCDLDVGAVFDAFGKHVVVVRGQRTAGQHQLGHGERRGKIDRLRRQPRPERIKRLQPRKQFAVERGRHRAGQGLIEMMMRVDQPGQHHMRAGIEALDRGRARFTPGPDQFDDAAVLHHDAALGPVRQNGERILDPKCGRGVVAHGEAQLRNDR